MGRIVAKFLLRLPDAPAGAPDRGRERPALFENTGTVPLKLTHSSTLSSGVLHVPYTTA